MTLPELLIYMGLLMVVTTLVLNTAITGTRAGDGTEVRLDNARQGELAMSGISKVLRTAVYPEQLEDTTTCTTCSEDAAIIKANRTRVVFYANMDNLGQGPSLVTLEVVEDPDATDESGMLVSSVQPPTAVGPTGYTYCNPATAGCRVVRRTVARGLVWPSPNVFTYYDYSGTAIAGTDVSRTYLPQITTIDVSVSVRTKTGDRYPTHVVTQRVRLPNADITLGDDDTTA